MSQHWYGRWAVATCCLSRHDLRNLLCLQVLHLYHEYPQNAGLFRVVHLHHISTVVSRCSFNMTAKDNAAIPVSVPVFVPLSLHAALPLLDQLKFLTCKFNLWMHQIGHIIKTTDRWSETHWSSCYNSMWCWETLGPGIHTDASEHESPNQTLLQTKYNLSQQLSWHCPPPSKTMLPATLQKVFSNSQRNMTKSSRYRPGLQIPHIQIQLSICGIYMNKSDPRRPHLITHRTQRINCQSPGARHRRTTSEGLCPCPNGSEPRLIYVGT